MNFVGQANPQRKKVEQKLLESGGGVRELLLNGYGVCLGDDEKVLEIVTMVTRRCECT